VTSASIRGEAGPRAATIPHAARHSRTSSPQQHLRFNHAHCLSHRQDRTRQDKTRHISLQHRCFKNAVFLRCFPSETHRLKASLRSALGMPNCLRWIDSRCFQRETDLSILRKCHGTLGSDKVGFETGSVALVGFGEDDGGRK
jgi:hypothetical protein